MKKTFITLVMLLAAFTLTAQEKKINFSKGTVQICTSAKINISGYDGKQVVIKGNSPDNFFYRNTNNSFIISGQNSQGLTTVDSISGIYFSDFSRDKEEKAKGLKPLGSGEDEDSTPIDQHFEIQLSGDNLLIRDKSYNTPNEAHVFFYSNNTYEILVPNSVKLMVTTSDCNEEKNPQRFIFSSDALKVASFEGQLQVNSKYKAVDLTDVSGPALVNTLGGDVKVVFAKKRPNKLFSIISNDGDIDITMTPESKVTVSIAAQEVLSNLDFKLLTENFVNNQKIIKAELNGGGKTFDLKTDYGTVYLRKN